MTPQIFSHGNFLAFAKFSSRQSFLVKFPSWHLFLLRKKQLEKWKKWKQELKIKTSILPGFFVWILPWHICLFCAAPLLEREFDLEKVPKLNVIFFCPGSYLPLSPSHCCLLTFPRVWVIVITFSEVPNHLATSRGKSNIFGHENHPELTSMPLQSYTWPFAKFGLCQLKCIRDPLELQEFRKYFDLLS